MLWLHHKEIPGIDVLADEKETKNLVNLAELPLLAYVTISGNLFDLTLVSGTTINEN